jgi:CubicO group peptidase (beta-lactamase class C family)
MKHVPKLVVALTLIAASALPAGAQRWTLPLDVQVRVDSVFSFVERGAPGCALGIIQDGKLAYGRGYGVANLDWGVPITTSTVFDIGSVTKQFTAAAVALLDLEGVLHVDDEVHRWIPELPEYEHPITVRQLLNHTSGVRDYLTLMDLQGFEFANVFDELDGVELIARQQGLNFRPGSEFLYSNSGYLLLANIVRRATGQSMRAFLEARFFDPLGMAHTSIWDDNTEILAERATGYSPGGQSWEIDHAWNFQMGGDGQVITSVDDLVRWDALFYDPVVGGQPLLDHLHTRGILNSGDTIPYAMGLNVDVYHGLRRVRHGGAWAGFRAHLVRFPEQHTSAAVLCNRGDADAGGYAMAVMDRVLADQLPPAVTEAEASEGAPPAAVTLSPEQLQRWVGVYRTPDRPNFWRFEVRDGALHAVLPNGSLVLRPLSETRFVAEEYGLPVGFQPQTEEWPEGVRVGGTVFLRQPPVTLTNAERAALEGAYYSSELDAVYEIRTRAGQLELHRPNRDPIPFWPAPDDEFEGGGVAYVLERDPTGRPSGFRVYAGRVTGIRFEKAGG